LRVTVTRTLEWSSNLVCGSETGYAQISQPLQQEQQQKQCKQLNKEVTPEAAAARTGERAATPAATHGMREGMLKSWKQLLASSPHHSLITTHHPPPLNGIEWQLKLRAIKAALTAAQGKNHSKPGRVKERKRDRQNDERER